MALPIVTSIVGWLRAGYPEGVPERDYMPLFALLGSQLTNADVNAIADALASETDPTTAQAIHDAIKAITHEHVQDNEMARVRARLAAGGWPLANPEHVN